MLSVATGCVLALTLAACGIPASEQPRSSMDASGTGITTTDPTIDSWPDDTLSANQIERGRLDHDVYRDDDHVEGSPEIGNHPTTT